jgi:putative ABC transport system substrate-binding protein
VNRREFICGLGGAATWPLAARAQQTIPVIGFLSGRSLADSAKELKAFHQGLAEAGYIEGNNVAIEYRWADGNYDRLPTLALDLVARRISIIAAVGGGASGLAAKSVTSNIPIVFATGGDAVQIGLVTSINRPGGNITGVIVIFGALGPKRLGLLHELIPATTSVGMLVNPTYPSARIEVQDVEAAGKSLALSVHVAEARNENEIAAAFGHFVERNIGALLVADDPFLQSQRARLVFLAARHALPAIYFSRDFVEAEGLMSYGPNLPDVYRLVGVYSGRILKGESAGNLPVLQPTKFELLINLRTVKSLNITVPPTLLARADEVIE